MKTLLKLGEMLQYLPTQVKDAINHVAKDSGQKTDDLELHRHGHSEKAAVNGLDPRSRCALKYVSARTQDRDDEIVIPEVIQLGPFRKYMHVLFNHNYSLPPIGSDRTIEADEFGIKALTEYADTGVGTMANVMWALVSQGHQKASSIGFVPTSFTKPGARDWDHVANQLQSNWKEFDKSRAEKSISRIITGGVLLEHSDVTVPCNVDAEMVQVIKALHVEDKVLKQFGWEMKDGIIVNKAAVADPVPCTCDECGFVADAVVGARCPECKTGAMKAKGKEKAIVVISKGGPGSGNFGHEGRPGEVGGSGPGGGGVSPASDLEGVRIVGSDQGAERVDQIFSRMMDDGYSPKFSGAFGERHGPIGNSTFTQEWTKGNEKVTVTTRLVRDQREKEKDVFTFTVNHETSKSFSPEIKVVRPAPSVKVLFVPPSGAEIAQRVGEAVEKALSRRTGRIL